MFSLSSSSRAQKRGMFLLSLSIQPSMFLCYYKNLTYKSTKDFIQRQQHDHNNQGNFINSSVSIHCFSQTGSIIIILSMQFVYSAITSSQTPPTKGKASKWRHLETMLTQLLLIGLVFFVILQNGSLRKEMNYKLSEDYIEDILNQNMELLIKEFEEVKLKLTEAINKERLNSEEIKALVRLLTKEIGLPLPESLERASIKDTTTDNAVQENHYETYQLIEYQDNEEEQSSQTQNLSVKISKVSTSDLEQAETDSEDFHIQETVQLISDKVCTYYQYLSKQAAKSQMFKQRSKWRDTLKISEGESYRNRMNLSYSVNINNKGSLINDSYLQHMKVFLLIIGNLFLIILFILGLVMLISFIANRRNRIKCGDLAKSLLKMSHENKRGLNQKAEKDVLRL